MTRREKIAELWHNGMTINEIAKIQGISPSGVFYYTKTMPKKWFWNKQRAVSKGVKIGGWKNVPDEVIAIAIKEIRGDETIIACLSRLVASMSQKKEEP